MRMLKIMSEQPTTEHEQVQKWTKKKVDEACDLTRPAEQPECQDR